MKKIYTLILCACVALAGICASSNASATEHENSKKRKKKSTRLKREDAGEGSGLNIKFTPAPLLNSAVVEFEYPISQAFSLGLNFGFKYALADVDESAPEINNNDLLENGYLAELSLKYYLFNPAPQGFYLQGTVGYGPLVYGDGSYRPLSINKAGHEFGDPNQVNTLFPASGLRGGVGLGYQFVLAPRHLVANLGAGVQLVGTEDGAKPSLFLAPSVGFIF